MIAVLTMAAASVLRAADTAQHIGRKIDDFTLRDCWGKAHRMADHADKSAVVVVFVGTECPLAKLYGPRLAELSKKFSDRGVAFLAIDSNQQDSLTELQQYARLHAIEFPVLKDTDNVVADQFAATRTPEAFVLDREQVIRYHGRIDDQYGIDNGISFQRLKPLRP